MSDDTTLNHTSIRHAYQQVADAIAARIAAGQYPRKLPGELDLAREFGVSYPTVRHAMAILRERDLEWSAVTRLLEPKRQRSYDLPVAGSADVSRLAGWVERLEEGNRNSRLFWAACRAVEAGESGTMEARASAQSAYLSLPLAEHTKALQPQPQMTGSFARELRAAATAMTAGRYLLHTHFASVPDGGRQFRSEWASVITSESGAAGAGRGTSGLGTPDRDARHRTHQLPRPALSGNSRRGAQGARRLPSAVSNDHGTREAVARTCHD